MEPGDIINSGILESYVLGTASVQEVARIHNMLLQHPELQQEIERIEHTLLLLAGKDVPEIPSHIKENIRTKVFSENAGTVVVNLAETRPAAKSSYKYGMAASVALLITSAVVNVVLYSKLHVAEQTVADLNQEKSVLAQQMEISRTSLQEAHASIALMGDTMMKAIRLKGLGNSPAAMAYVYWDTRSREVYVNVMELPAPPKGKQYQLWALANGKPVDAGVFSAVDTMQLQKLKVVAEADAFAVTLEKEGGNPTPTLSAMYLMGALH